MRKLVNQKVIEDLKIEFSKEKLTITSITRLIEGVKEFDVIENFILKVWKIHLKSSVVTFVDSKTKLQEYSLKKFKILPIYKLLDNSGPRHKPIFKVGVRLQNLKMVKATGNSKKDAQQKAATLLLKHLDK